MTPDQVTRVGRALRRASTALSASQREAKLRQGLARPRNAKEWALFAADLREAVRADGQEYDENTHGD